MASSDVFILLHGALMFTSFLVMTTFTIYLRRILALKVKGAGQGKSDNSEGEDTDDKARKPRRKKAPSSIVNQVLHRISQGWPAWLPLDFEDAHLMVQGVAVLLSLAAFNFAVFACSSHFQSLHSWIGVGIMVIYGLVLPFTGLVDISFEEKTQRMLVNWHRQYGRIVWQLSFLGVATGFIQLWKWFT